MGYKRQARFDPVVAELIKDPKIRALLVPFIEEQNRRWSSLMQELTNIERTSAGSTAQKVTERITQGGAGGGLANPMVSRGDMIQGGEAGVPERLAAGLMGQVLMTFGAGASLGWSDVQRTNSVAIAVPGIITVSFTKAMLSADYIPFCWHLDATGFISFPIPQIPPVAADTRTTAGFQVYVFAVGTLFYFVLPKV